MVDTITSGHYGHVELALPTFHPLLFNELYRLLRATCFSCKCLRMSKDQKAYFVRILKLLREGRVKDGNNELMSDLGVMPLLPLPSSSFTCPLSSLLFRPSLSTRIRRVLSLVACTDLSLFADH